MGPLTLEWWRQDLAVRETLEDAQHFLFEDDRIWKTAKEIAWAQVDDPDFVFSCSLPSPTTVLEFPEITILIRRQGDNVEFTMPAGFGKAVGMQVFPRTKNMRFISRGISEAAIEFFEATGDLMEYQTRALATIATVCDVILDLIAEPRLIERTSPSRPQRRAAKRILAGSVPIAWHKVGWTVGESTRPKVDHGDDTWRAPLHFCRAHWRRSQEGRPSAERRPGRPGWWCFVRHSWKGHPDFGIRLHHYTPKIDPDGKSLATIMAAKRAVKSWASA